MAKIKHVAMTVNNPDSAASCYCEVFDLREVMRTDDNEAVALTDGHISFVLLKVKTDPYGGGRLGLHHFGFEVDDVLAIDGRLQKLGATEITEYNEKHDERENPTDPWVGEKKWIGPDGVTIDINQDGWDIGN